VVSEKSAQTGAQKEHFGGQDFGGQSGKILVGNSTMPTKKNRPLPTKIPTEIEERRGWIEFPKKGTKNPRRYAQRRRWIRQDGEWVKSKPRRIKSIPPMDEVTYVKYKSGQEDRARQERRQRRERNRGG
jgi:hypothetical protein